MATQPLTPPIGFVPPSAPASREWPHVSLRTAASARYLCRTIPAWQRECAEEAAGASCGVQCAPRRGSGPIFGSVALSLDRRSRLRADSPVLDCHPAPTAEFLAETPSAKLSAENERFRHGLSLRER